jgi:Uma2 family endonuclease
MTTAATPRLTAREFEAHPLAERAELVHGEIRPVSPTGFVHARIVADLHHALYAHVEARGLGMCFSDSLGYVLPHRDDTLRAPDVSVLLAAHIPETSPAGFFHGAPDLAVEVLSPSDTYAEVVERLDDYFAAGVPVVWVVHPRRRGVERRTPDGPPRWLAEDAVLDGAPVLPDFRLPVADLFRGVSTAGA